MKLFVWGYVGQLTGNYHSGGGLLVVAKSEKTARKLANATTDVKLDPKETPDYVVKVADDAAEKVMLFPDAGCC